MIRWLCLLSLLAVGCGSRAVLPMPTPAHTWEPTASEPFRASRPPPIEVPVASDEGRITQLRLPNGLAVIVVARPDLPIVSVRYVNRAAVAEDVALSPAIATVVAFALDHGTRMKDGSEGTALSLAGTEPDIAVRTTGTEAHLELPAEHVAKALELLSLWLRHPLLDPHALELAKREVLSGVIGASARSSVLQDHLLNKAFFGASHPLAISSRRLAERVVAVTATEATAFHRERYRPDTSALVVVGAVDPTEVFRAAQASFGDWPTPGSPLPSLPTASHPERQSGKVLALLTGDEEIRVALSQRVEPAKHPDFAIFLVLCGLLADFSSAPMQTLRHEQGATYGLSCNMRMYPGGARLQWLTQVSAGELGRSVEAMRAELRRLRAEVVSEAELHRAREWAADWVGPERNSALSAQLTLYWALGLEPEDVRALAGRIRGVSATEVRRVALGYLDPNLANIVVMGDLYRVSGSVLKDLGNLEYFEF